MNTAVPNIPEIPYLHDLVSMSDSLKLRLISLLSESMINKHPVEAESEKTYTERMLKKHAGKWKGDESADAIMARIRENSSIRQNVTL